MAQSRSIVKRIFDNFWNSIKPKKQWGEVRGVDQYGTTYYESTESSIHRNGPSRWFTPKNPDNFNQDLPVEWQSWLWHRRRDPPTPEEIEYNAQKTLQMVSKADKIEEPKTEKVIAIEESSFPSYKEYEINPGEKEQTQK